MSVILRFKRLGNTHRPFYNLVATDVRNSRDGKFIERLGHYDPTATPSVLKVDEARVQHWYSLGAEVSNTVKKLLKKNNINVERARPVTTPKKKK